MIYTVGVQHFRKRHHSLEAVAKLCRACNQFFITAHNCAPFECEATSYEPLDEAALEQGGFVQVENTEAPSCAQPVVDENVVPSGAASK